MNLTHLLLCGAVCGGVRGAAYSYTGVTPLLPPSPFLPLLLSFLSFLSFFPSLFPSLFPSFFVRQVRESALDIVTLLVARGAHMHTTSHSEMAAIDEYMKTPFSYAIESLEGADFRSQVSLRS